MSTSPSASTTSKAYTKSNELDSDVRRLTITAESSKNVMTEEFPDTSDLTLCDGEHITGTSDENLVVEEPSPPPPPRRKSGILISLPADEISSAGIPEKHFTKAHSRTNTFGNLVQDDISEYREATRKDSLLRAEISVDATEAVVE